MIAASAALLIRNSIEKSQAEEEAKERLVKVEQAIEERSGKETQSESSDESAVVLPMPENKKRMPEVEIDGFWYVGYLDLPALEAKVPVLTDYEDDKLKLSACCYFGSVETEDLVIAGHNYMTGFCRLGDLKSGDEVSFTNMDGETYYYEVAETELLNPQQVEEMVESDYELTLFSCNYSGSQRYTVRCHPTKSDIEKYAL